MVLLPLASLICLFVGPVLDKGQQKPNASLQMVYKHPFSERLGFFLLSMTFLILLVPIQTNSIAWFYTVFDCITLLACLYLAGPQEIRFDLEKRTYYSLIGWPIFPKRRKGFIDEIAGIVVLTPRVDINLVSIKWKDSRRRDLTIAKFSNLARAKNAAVKAAKTLNISLL